jgi:ankyrin repeat protein
MNEFINSLCNAANSTDAIALDRLLSSKSTHLPDALNRCDDAQQRTALACAAANGHVASVARLLVSEGLDPNVVDASGATALYLAASQGHADVVHCLLATPRINRHQLRMSGNVSPLFIAAQNGHRDVVDALLVAEQLSAAPVRRALLDLYCETNAITNEGTKVLETTAICIAAQNGHDQIVELLLAAGADPNRRRRPDDVAPIVIAAEHGRAAVLRCLVRGPIEIDADDKRGCTALFQAAQNGFVGVVLELLRAGATVDRATHGGSTPLMVAAISGHPAIVAALLAAGADTSLTRKGETALDRALASANASSGSQRRAVLDCVRLLVGSSDAPVGQMLHDAVSALDDHALLPAVRQAAAFQIRACASRVMRRNEPLCAMANDDVERVALVAWLREHLTTHAVTISAVLRVRNATFALQSNIGHKERVFHYTKPQVLPLIVRSGVNSRFCGEGAAAAYFGVGHYFSPFLEYALEGYSYRCQDVHVGERLWLRWAVRARRGVVREAYLLETDNGGASFGELGAFRFGIGGSGVLHAWSAEANGAQLQVGATGAAQLQFVNAGADLLDLHGAIAAAASNARVRPPTRDATVSVGEPFIEVLVCDIFHTAAVAVTRAATAGQLCDAKCQATHGKHDAHVTRPELLVTLHLAPPALAELSDAAAQSELLDALESAAPYEIDRESFVICADGSVQVRAFSGNANDADSHTLTVEWRSVSLRAIARRVRERAEIVIGKRHSLADNDFRDADADHRVLPRFVVRFALAQTQLAPVKR